MFGLGGGGIFSTDCFSGVMYICISEMLDSMNYLAFDCVTQCFRLSIAMNSVYRAAKGKN